MLKSLHEAVAEEVIKVAVERALVKHRAGEGKKLDRQFEIHRELSLIEAHEGNLVDAIANGQPMDPLLAKLRVEVTRRKDLILELEQLTAAGEIASLDEARLKREMKARFADFKGLLDRHVSTARRLLRTLMEHPLRCQAVRDGNRRNIV